MRCVRWAGHVARIEEKKCAHNILIVNCKAKRLLGRPGFCVSVILKLVLNKCPPPPNCGLDLSGSGYGTVVVMNVVVA
jgi:hypothetical protein